MSTDWYIGISTFCSYWSHAAMLQQTFETLEQQFEANNDACIDASKAIVECACRVIIANLDDPNSPLKPKEQNPDFGAWMSAAIRVLELSEIRDEAFKKLISQYHKLTTTLGDLRNKAGTISHGKDAFIAKLSLHQRRAALLAADAIVTFLHEAYLERETDPVLSLEPYDRFKASNALIDQHVSMSADENEAGILEVLFRLPNKDEIPIAIEASQLLFSIDREAYKQALNASKEAEENKVPDNGELE